MQRKNIAIATQHVSLYIPTPHLFLFNSRIIRRKNKAKTIKRRYLFDLTLFSFFTSNPIFLQQKSTTQTAKNSFFSTPTPPFSSQEQPSSQSQTDMQPTKSKMKRTQELFSFCIYSSKIRIINPLKALKLRCKS